jgi:hypothetical protein
MISPRNVFLSKPLALQIMVSMIFVVLHTLELNGDKMVTHVLWFGGQLQHFCGFHEKFMPKNKNINSSKLHHR